MTNLRARLDTSCRAHFDFLSFPNTGFHILRRCVADLFDIADSHQLTIHLNKYKKDVF